MTEYTCADCDEVISDLCYDCEQNAIERAFAAARAKQEKKNPPRIQVPESCVSKLKEVIEDVLKDNELSENSRERLKIALE